MSTGIIIGSTDRIVKHTGIINSISKKYGLEFDKKFKYYIGDAYVNDKGESLPYYMYCHNRIFKLEYFSGCFNPFLIELDRNKFGIIHHPEHTTKVIDVVYIDNNKTLKRYQNKYGTQLSF